VAAANNSLKLNTAKQMIDSQATLSDLTSWQSSLRAAMVNTIDENDMAAIVQTQLAKAKQGDEKALRFILEVVGAKTPVTITNNLVVDSETAAKLVRSNKNDK
jgi:hypothetical protein